MDVILHLPSVVMLQNANNEIPGFIEDSKYLPLIASSSLILISLQDSAASSVIEPSGTSYVSIKQDWNLTMNFCGRQID